MYPVLTQCTSDIAAVLQELLQSMSSDFDTKQVSFILETELRTGSDMAGYEILSGEQPSHIKIRYTRKNELCHAFYRLCMSEGPLELPITGKCSFEDLGIMLDCARNAVPNINALKQMIRLCALMGYSFVGLYLEDVFTVPEEPHFGYMRGRYSEKELQELDAYASSFGIELRPYIQTLAHMNAIIRYETYEKITDTDDILLIGEERTYELLDHMLAAISRSFSSRKINLGMDEAQMVGLGKYLNRNGFEERTGLMCRHLNRVLQLCRPYGFEPEIWSDMFFRLISDGEYYLTEDLPQETIRKALDGVSIPDDLTLVYWDYYHLDEKVYDRMIHAHQVLTDRISFAGGAWKWNGFAPHNRYSIKIGKAAISSCRNAGLSSAVITMWGDDGAECDLFSVLPSLIADSRLAWNEDYSEDEALVCLTGYTLEEFLALDDCNPYNTTGEDHNNCSKYLLYDDPLFGVFESLVREDTSLLFEKSAGRLFELAKKESPYAYLFETAAALCAVLTGKSTLSLRIKAAYDANDRDALRQIAEKEIPELIDKLRRFYTCFRKQWMKNARPFGFEVQSIRIGGLIQRMEDTKLILESFLYGEMQQIEELEQNRQPFAYYSGEIETMNYNRWADTATPAVMGMGIL